MKKVFLFALLGNSLLSFSQSTIKFTDPLGRGIPNFENPDIIDDFGCNGISEEDNKTIAHKNLIVIRINTQTLKQKR